MLELIGAFVAGILTTLAPCVLPVLPVVVGGSVAPVETGQGGGVAVATRMTQTRRGPADHRVAGSLNLCIHHGAQGINGPDRGPGERLAVDLRRFADPARRDQRLATIVGADQLPVGPAKPGRGQA